MDLKQLKYFITIAKEGSISNASRTLHISQPPLSTQMHLLEKELGCQLFERGPRTIKLTPAGELLLEHAENILRLTQNAVNELQDLRTEYAGVLKLGVVSSVGSTFLCDILKGFHELYPKIRFEITEANTYQLIEQLRNGVIEIAMIRTPFPDTGLEVSYIKSEKIFAVGKKSLLCKSNMTLKDLENVPLIIYRRWEQILKDLFSQAAIHMDCLCVNDDARTTAYLAASGLGVGIIPESALPLITAKDLGIQALAEETLASRIAIVKLKGKKVSPFTQLFSNYNFCNN